MTLFISIFFAVNLVGFSSKENSSEPCINVLFDGDEGFLNSEDSKFKSLVELLKKWTHLKQKFTPIARYTVGGLEACPISIYLGSNSEVGIPREFIKDLVRTNKRVIWVGYNIWQLGESLEKVLGVRYVGLTRWDSPFVNKMQRPFYFNEIFFEGRKYYRIPPEEVATSPLGQISFDKIEILPVNLEKFQVLAESRHGVTREILPYILRSRNLYYVADVPEVFISSEIAHRFFSDIL